MIIIILLLASNQIRSFFNNFVDLFDLTGLIIFIFFKSTQMPTNLDYNFFATITSEFLVTSVTKTSSDSMVLIICFFKSLLSLFVSTSMYELFSYWVIKWELSTLSSEGLISLSSLWSVLRLTDPSIVKSIFDIE